VVPATVQVILFCYVHTFFLLDVIPSKSFYMAFKQGGGISAYSATLST
jgi:hypothetical protein